MYKKYFKRILDIAVSLVALPFILFIILIFAPIIHFTDGGTVFYNGTRLGVNGKPFEMYKLRSMRMNAPDIRNADGTTFNSENDERVTKVGRFIRKTSIDELPQFLNVLKGDMSIVGPRPNTRLEGFTEQEKIYLSVRPGITGYSQAYFRNSSTAIDTANRDAYYAQNVTLLFDIKILFKTVASVLCRENVYRNSDDTVPAAEQSNEETLVK